MSKLTKREKTLIIILIVIAVVFIGGRFVVMPMLDKNADLRSQVETLEFEKQRMDNLVLNEESLKNTLALRREEFKAIMGIYPHFMETEEVDYVISLHLINSNMKPLVLDMAEITPVQVTESMQNGEAQVQQTAKPRIATVEAEVVTKGSLGEISNFIGKINATTNMTVLTINISQDDDEFLYTLDTLIRVDMLNR